MNKKPFRRTILVLQVRKILGLTDNFYFAKVIVFYLILLIALFWDIIYRTIGRNEVCSECSPEKAKQKM